MRSKQFWHFVGLAGALLTITGCPSSNSAKREATRPIIVGFDENYQTLDGIKSGECYATVVQNPYEFGYQSVKILAGLAQGKEEVLKQLADSKTKEPLTIDAQNRIFIPHRVINKQNVDEFYRELKKLKSEPAGLKAEGATLKVAFVSNNAFDFWTIAEQGTQQASKDLNVAVAFRKPPQGTKEEQQQIIEDLVNLGVKGIAVSPNDAANSVDFFKKINARLPLVMQDSDLPDTSARRCYIGTHNYRAGLAVGKLVTEAAPKGGKIAIFVGKLDVQNAQERRQGVLDYLMDPKTTRQEMGDLTPADAANLKVGNYLLVTTLTDNANENTCQERAQELLLTNPDLVCLIGLWEYNPPALLRAVRNSGKAR
jgi:ABC-type sugar transport system substrate-binding protein